MALPSTGPLAISAVNVELGVASTTTRSIGESVTRTLYGVATGPIRLAADGYGKANRIAYNMVISGNTTNLTVSIASVPGYVAGKTDLTITVNSGIYLYSTATSTPALTIAAFNAADTVKVVNNGYIMGMGGTNVSGPGAPGGPAISILNSIIMTNNSSIGGGGGSGGAPGNGTNNGGGGAGGGAGGIGASGVGGTSGGSGGNPGLAGSNGVMAYWVNAQYAGGGGGGRIMPGDGGAAGTSSYLGGTTAGSGGGAGGGGGGNGNAYTNGGGGGAGGGGGGAGIVSGSFAGGGGGGGWGAAGGAGLNGGGAGGKAINLNGYSVTYITTGTIYGAVS